LGAIFLGGSNEQKQKWLPPMARMEKIGSFGLTEPLVGSGTGGGLTTTADRRDWPKKSKTRAFPNSKRQLSSVI
jgi:alkylation response protein AidB-like acyl-CoA dehydrogenase